MTFLPTVTAVNTVKKNLSQYFWKEQFDTFETDVMFSGQRFEILAMFLS